MRWEVEEPDIEDPAFSNVAYKVEDSEFWRWNVLPEAVKKRGEEREYPGGYTDRHAKHYGMVQ